MTCAKCGEYGMPTRNRRRLGGRWTAPLLALPVALLIVLVVRFPKPAFEASLQGLTVWWNVVFPGYLPFLILSEIAVAFGLVHGFGALLNPLMRAGLRLPGVGGWAVGMGIAAGYAAGADAAARLRERGWISKREGDKLVALSYVCSPFWIIGVAAAGFFGNPRIGWLLTAVHLMAWLATALLLRGTGTADHSAADQAASRENRPSRRGGLLRAAFHAMAEAQKEDGRGLGKLLGDAVIQSVQTLFAIGGWMMFVSVLLEMLRRSVLSPLWLHLSAAVPFLRGGREGVALIDGLFELHLGIFAASRAVTLPANWQAAVAAAIAACGGLAAYAQVKSAIRRTDLSMRLYIAARAIHSVLSLFITLWMWEPLTRWTGLDRAAWLPERPPLAQMPPPVSIWRDSLTASLCLLAVLLLLSFALRLRFRTWRQPPRRGPFAR